MCFRFQRSNASAGLPDADLVGELSHAQLGAGGAVPALAGGAAGARRGAGRRPPLARAEGRARHARDAALREYLPTSHRET